MLSRKNVGRFTLAVVTIALSVSFIFATSLVDYRFKIQNKSSSKLTKLWASPDGKKYLPFNIGSGLKSGGVMELVWDQSTDNGNCEWFLKAGFADGSESEPAEFDFCEEDLVIDFTN